MLRTPVVSDNSTTNHYGFAFRNPFNPSFTISYDGAVVVNGLCFKLCVKTYYTDCLVFKMTKPRVSLELYRGIRQNGRTVEAKSIVPQMIQLIDLNDAGARASGTFIG